MRKSTAVMPPEGSVTSDNISDDEIGACSHGVTRLN